MWRALHLQDGGLPRCSVELMFVRCSKGCEAEAEDVRLSRVSIILFPLKCVSSVRSRLALFTGDFWVCRGKKASSTSQSHHVVDGFPSCVTHPWEQISITLFFVITQEGKNHQLFKKIGQPVSFEQLPRVHGLVWWRRAFVKLKLTCGKMSPIIMWDELSWSFLTSLWKSVFCMMCWCKRDLLSMTCRQLRKSNPTRPQSRKLLSAQFQWLVVERQRPPANVS